MSSIIGLETLLEGSHSMQEELQFRRRPVEGGTVSMCGHVLSGNTGML